jgi:TolB protein
MVKKAAMKNVLNCFVIFAILMSAISAIAMNSNNALNSVSGHSDPCFALSSTVIYVPDDYSTIQRAVDAAKSGETIIVRDGRYTGNVVVNKPHLTIRSDNGAGATIVQAANSNDHVFEVTADYVTISGFTVKGATENPNAGICLHYADYCNISGNNVSNNYYGIYIYMGYSAVTNEGTMPLTSSSLWQDDPIWSLDGTKILYTTGGYEIYKPPDIWVMNAEGSNKTQLTTDPTLQAFASWSLDGTKIVYASDQSGSRDIWVMNADGSNKIQLTTDPKAQAHPSWSPDGTKIIYETESGSYETHNVDIWIMNADGTGKTQLTSDANIERSYSLSRTGKIAYEKYMGNYNWDIWIMDLDGGNKRQLTTDISQETDPLISPDGSKIAYNKFTGSKWLEIWVMVSDGSNKKRLSTGAVRVREASWSPDGTKLAFRAGVPYQIFVINADGTMKTQLTTGASYNLQPIWSPDGEKIAYVSAKSTDLSGEANIWLMTLGGSNYSSNNKLYLNNFIDNTDNLHSVLSTNLWNSTSKITYTYKDNTYTNYLGNYWDDYMGSDADGDGIGDTPYNIDSESDNHPLMDMFENYRLGDGEKREGIIAAQITAGADDGFVARTPEYFSADSKALTIGTDLKFDAFLRFPDLKIPANATITKAYIGVVPAVTNQAGPMVNISAADVANPAAPTTSSDCYARKRTASSVNWDASSWAAGESENSTDISNVIQELVDSYDYSAGAPILIFLDIVEGGTENQYFAAFENVEYEAPKLFIEYSTGVSTGGGLKL